MTHGGLEDRDEAEHAPWVRSALFQFCDRIVSGGALADKLTPPSAELVAEIGDAMAPEPPHIVTAPVRDLGLALHPGAERLPRLAELTQPAARVACLSRFAHHELMAVELFAWAVLAFPQLPPALLRGFVITLAEEQEHCRLYLDRLKAHGATFGALPLSDYFWQHVPAILAAPKPPLAFLCAMGLTFEQANLDFTRLYRDAFARAGDTETAAVLERVHQDEVGHVKLAATWVARLAPAPDAPGSTAPVDALLASYTQHVPFPLSLARAKGRRFERGARARAGLSPAFIAATERARPYDASRNGPADTGA